ncbi:glutamine--fructose-6-phosphate transaminase (isomerizing) [uncultured Mailhella sp.]|uniref:glutamine--fructose-6-phosphate transaminase (isomerizing) n=1 Tax=uncultured Mailhella sp. TaxID=1981031 RepID=UPI0025D0360E|nr:glutamine--fructose-6-phosphate transaminase (isomerizing) [uncultured Mailhella sp.]
MCGIIGYSGHRPAVPLLVEGLHRLEYRGYDSSGVAFEQAGRLHVVKAAGKLAALEAKLENNAYLLATSGIGHTRWATHGLPVEKNAHPHLSQDGDIAIIHNGIIENFQEIKDELSARGHTFLSDTDTEVLAHLIGEERKSAPSLCEAFARALRRAHGAYAVVMMGVEEPGVIYAARMAAPLLMGVGVGECFVASDIPAFLPYTREVVFLEDGEVARIEGAKWQVFSLADLSPVKKSVSHVPWDMQAAAKGGYKHFMLKEIMEQPRVITDCLTGRVSEGSDGELSVHLQELDDIPVPARLHIVACGTSYNAGLWGQQLLENVGGIPTDLDIASEFRYRDPILLPGEAVMVISQSGETADTLAALRLAKEKGCRVIGLCNVVGSSIAREADVVLYTQAGPEISVASTKAMCSQMVLLALMALYYGQRRTPAVFDRELLAALHALPEKLSAALPAMQERAGQLALRFASSRSFFYLGRGQCHALALEGALKLKELSYIHAEGYAAGEMKHGPIALIDPQFPTFALALDNALFPKVKSNIQEVLARQGRVIALVQEKNGKVPDLSVEELWVLPAAHPVISCFFALPALQLFSYQMADYLGKDVDQPRNLAKSVTVE